MLARPGGHLPAADVASPSDTRLARLISGLVVLAIGIAMTIAWALPTASWLAWTATILTLAASLFQIFEAWKGWCVMRAMGYKTPM